MDQFLMIRNKQHWVYLHFHFEVNACQVFQSNFILVDSNLVNMLVSVIIFNFHFQFIIFSIHNGLFQCRTVECKIILHQATCTQELGYSHSPLTMMYKKILRKLIQKKKEKEKAF